MLDFYVNPSVYTIPFPVICHTLSYTPNITMHCSLSNQVVLLIRVARTWLRLKYVSSYRLLCCLNCLLKFSINPINIICVLFNETVLSVFYSEFNYLAYFLFFILTEDAKNEIPDTVHPKKRQRAHSPSPVSHKKSRHGTKSPNKKNKRW